MLLHNNCENSVVLISQLKVSLYLTMSSNVKQVEKKCSELSTFPNFSLSA